MASMNTKEEHYNCDECLQVFENSDSLRMHILSSHVKVDIREDFECEICTKRFVREYNLLAHLGDHAGEKRYKCVGCKKTFANSGVLRMHILLSHSNRTDPHKFPCQECHSRFCTKHDLAAHLKIHNDEKQYKCGKCPKCFENLAVLRMHVLLSHEKVLSPDNFHCKICSRGFARKYNLMKHMKFHANEKRYKCDECSKSFTNSGVLRMHILLSHEKPEENAQCHVCNVEFVNKEDLVVHMETHAEKKLFKCKQCSKSYNSSGLLMIHILISHTEVPPGENYQCALCSNRFFNKHDFAAHMHVHSDEKPSFRNLSSLKSHKQTHTNEKSYVCELCSKEFSHKGYLERHMEKHLQEKHYKCSVCSKTCNIYSNLRIHMQLHANEDSNMQSTTKLHANEDSDMQSSIKLHGNKDSDMQSMKSHANENSLQCAICSKNFTNKQLYQWHVKLHVKENNENNSN